MVDTGRTQEKRRVDTILSYSGLEILLLNKIHSVTIRYIFINEQYDSNELQ